MLCSEATENPYSGAEIDLNWSLVGLDILIGAPVSKCLPPANRRREKIGFIRYIFCAVNAVGKEIEIARGFIFWNSL